MAGFLDLDSEEVWISVDSRHPLSVSGYLGSHGSGHHNGQFKSPLEPGKNTSVDT